MMYDAFFISPEGNIVPVSVRHIVTIAGEPESFGLTSEHIVEVYRKHKENVGWEGYARNEIILELLRKDWTRLRFFARSGTWRVQVCEALNERLTKNILHFCREVKKGNVTNLLHRKADPNIEIHNTNENVIFRGDLDEAMMYLNSNKNGGEACSKK